MDANTYAIVCLLVGMATVLGLIIFLKANAFIALITAARARALIAGRDAATPEDVKAVAYRVLAAVWVHTFHTGKR